ncbi:hypothetical protein Tco_1065819 [Tanacetum coccineum]
MKSQLRNQGYETTTQESTCELERLHLVPGCLSRPIAALAVLTTRPTCHSSLSSCLSSLGESLASVPDAYGQSLEALPSQHAASGSESHVPGVGS